MTEGNSTTENAEERLRSFFAQHMQVAVALSGGVDSTLLMRTAQQAGAQVRAYFVQTPLQPAFEAADARMIAESSGVELTVIPLDVLAVPEVAANGAERCYHCKRALLDAIVRKAQQDGYSLVVDGTNASDDANGRPGMRALQELGVRSPLRESGITKAQVRELARNAELPTWNKPSYACLATRIPCGEPLTNAALRATEQAEDALHALGFSDFRVRRFHDCARLQLREEQWSLLMRERAAVRKALLPFYDEVLLDLEVRDDER